MAQLGVGIIGCGNISTTYLGLAPLFAALEIRAVADINADAAALRAQEYSVPALGVDEILAAPDIDVIVNLTIPAVHYQITRGILEAGKHAYSEKPIVLSLQEGEDLRELAASRNLRVGSAPDTFLGGAHQLARAAIDEGLVGDIVAGTCHFMGHGMEGWHPNPDFFYQPGAGPVLDMGPYYLTNLVQLIGPVKTVAALATTGFGTRTIANGPRTGEIIPVDTPTNVHALLEFHNGATITLGKSWDVWKHRHDEMDLYGTKGSLYVPDPNFFGGPVMATQEGGDPVELPTRDHPFGVDNQDDENAKTGRRANYRCAGLADMVTAIDEGRAHRCNIDVAVHTVDVMTAILRSGAEKRFIDLTTTCDRPEALSPEQARALMA